MIVPGQEADPVPFSDVSAPQDAAARAVGTVPTLEVSGLTIGYRRAGCVQRVVSDVSFTIPRGGAYGLVGESGCGKTTVAMSLMRYLPSAAVIDPASRVRFDGTDLLDADEATLRGWRGNRLAMVYQNPGTALNPSMPVGRQVAEVFRTHAGMDRAAATSAAADVLATVRIPDPSAMLGRYPHQLSGGQQQRVMIAMALAARPDLLVLDEPTTGLDATVEAEVLDLVAALRAELGTAVLFISHNLGVVARMCEQVGVLYAGRLVEEGPAAQVFADPAHPYTLGLLRSVPRAGASKATHRLEPIPGSLPAPGDTAPGCPYAPRCPVAVDRCRTELPPPAPVAPGRTSRCLRHGVVPTLPEAAAAAGPAGAREGGGVLLDVQDLTVRYGSGARAVTAVAGVTFEVRRGEVFGLVGESGSGKSTLAKTIVGMVQPTSGSVVLDGTELTPRARRRNRDLRRAVQMVFQNPDAALNPRHAVGSILGRAVRLLVGRMPGARLRERVVALARSVRLEEHHLDVRPAALSGGLKQRVAIARSFAGSPALVLCDEPVSALDVSVQAAILNLLADLQTERGVSYLFISHDLGVVRYLADRIGVMYLGQLVDVGPAEAVFQAPHHPYTEALVSAVPTLEDAPQQGAGRIRLDGTYPSLADPPSGCRFHTRCPRMLGDVCRTQEPPWQRTDSGNAFRCHIPAAELAQLQGADTADPVRG
jgi:peptide/nickel transport system ATP-binding protein